MEDFATEEHSSEIPIDVGSQSGRGKNKKHWNLVEDKALVKSILELVDAGTHRGDNGFKPGYLTVLEKKMSSRGFKEIKGTPHILSRIKKLKQLYATYDEMLTSDGLSGFGYNPDTGCIEAPKEVWNSLSEAQKEKFAKLENKPFPFYNDLHIIFGRDRATGKDAMSFGDMLEEDENENAESHGSPPVLSVGRNRKRKRLCPTNEIASAMKEIGEKISETGMALCAALQDQKIEMKRRLARDIMKIFPMVQVEEEMFLLGKIGKDVDMLSIFCEWDDEKKKRYMNSLLLARARGSNIFDDNV